MINNLIEIMEKEFDYFKSLSLKDDDEFLKVVSLLSDLSLKENSYIAELPKDITSLDNLGTMVHDFYKNDLSDKSFFVSLRLDSILDSLKADILDVSLDDALDDYFYDGYETYNFAWDKFLRWFVKNNDEFCFLASFSNKRISDILISNGFDFDKLDNLSSRDDDFEFVNFYEEQLYLEAQISLMSLVGTSEFDKSDLLFRYNSELFKSLLLSMNDFDFDRFKNEVFGSNFYMDSAIYDEILSIFDDVSKVRSLDNPVNFSIDVKLFDNLVTLVKFEEVLFKKFVSLNFNDEDSVRSFLSLIDYESELVALASACGSYADELSDVLDGDIKLFLNDDSLWSIISNRIKSLMPVFLDSSDGIEKNCNYVMRNHIINSLEEYKKFIYNAYSDDEAFEYVGVYKKVIFEYPDLFMDVVNMGFDFNILFSLDDVVTSKLLGFNSSINYSFDKDNILYNRGLELIDEIAFLSNNSDLIADYQFKICEFGDIINNVSAEHLYSLEDKVRDLNVPKVRNKLLRKFNFQYKY